MKLLLFTVLLGRFAAQEPVSSPEALYSRGLAATLPESQNYELAANLFRQAADRGLPRAKRSLGELYRDGRGVPKDLTEAVRLFRQAADQGDIVAQTDLGGMFADGLGVAKNEKEAVKWYRKAAEKNDISGQVALGVMYANGRGVSKNPREAIKWYRAAADQGSGIAQFALGSIFEGGFGDIARNKPIAIEWYTRALQQGFEPARVRLTALRNERILSPNEASANLLSKINRVDPALARAARINADVELEIVVDSNGSVKTWIVLSGHPLLNESAIETVKPLRYKPYVVNGQPVDFTTTITIEYRF